ncbi:MAG: 16S rRNA (cytosine(1402)-N(4))-methyltransferase [Candidatus Magasanikbacteria bacterium CG_4_9_14_0_2_um_filter_41_10]|uniref:Ribosomal RNA small subunit methyltransferase H n=1 Tax=Candidatus Magasanikbacteria bacterium CG_4_10_14_0_2_um_filter_41_31 TaxID=1974639 RepID=A0A2M7V5X8_9BACT|nr:MAG: 16S rRNA (cytosine(1402)-N(4))-methyltransferase [Candidatus Magasanikbacteria bacterium CG1_02_41_34]PIZ94025.1 MAG: 16S rRNA (cytosine(1402)-N(4))-methyltransferase [Candidatus Magasanikbacteria bacterium CG_4_10_14_0_2_um_filter_41_31]PJC53266.1 MAG: 16S rRNA (cytosine(1402)-N(4))-methyltransferase [Candidatus Magasanikbacteria bacterium CG_4_9_14_0_2_um_filter_41_10]
MKHVPVLLRETIDALQLKHGSNIIDCTLGDGGHTEAILKLTIPNGRVLGIDADPESLARAKQFLYSEAERVIFVRENFEHLAKIVSEEKFAPVNGILMDLGWSSPQFEERKRGFSFQNPDEPLDMRYAPHNDMKKASELLADSTEEELEHIFRIYGEERLSKEIAVAIKAYEQGINNTSDLVNIVLAVYRKKLKTDKEVPWVGGLHPATKVFQALRIAVNDEFGVIDRALPQAIEILAPGGRLAVISFHSGEDRIVKHYFKSLDKKTIRIITKKPIVASEQEAKENTRARSAKLRVVEKIY